MPRTLYAIRDWAQWFEKNHKDTEVMFRWVALPTRHDGKGYRRVARHPRACELFTAFVLMVEVAAKMPVRGVLEDEDGPLDADDLADATGFPSEIFALAFRVLSDSRERVMWIESRRSSDKFGQVPLTVQNSTEQNITKQNPLPPEGDELDGLPEIPASLKTPEFVSTMRDFVTFRRQIRKKLSPIGAGRLYAKLESWGPVKSVAALSASMENGWQGVFEPHENTRGKASANGKSATARGEYDSGLGVSVRKLE